MSNLDGYLIDEATAGVNAPKEGDQGKVVRVDDAVYPNPPNLRYQGLESFATELAIFTIPGPPGAAGFSQTFSAAASWVVNHNLGRHPFTWAVETLGGLEIDVAVQHVSANQSVVSFDTPVAGVAKFT